MGWCICGGVKRADTPYVKRVERYGISQRAKTPREDIFARDAQKREEERKRRGEKMYITCERCSANLDPGERCDCLDELERHEEDLRKMIEVDAKNKENPGRQLRFAL